MVIGVKNPKPHNTCSSPVFPLPYRWPGGRRVPSSPTPGPCFIPAGEAGPGRARCNRWGPGGAAGPHGAIGASGSLRLPVLRSKGLFKEACRAGLRREGRRGRSVGWERAAAGLHDCVLWGVAVVATADPVPACREAPRIPRSRARSFGGSTAAASGGLGLSPAPRLPPRTLGLRRCGAPRAPAPPV